MRRKLIPLLLCCFVLATTSCMKETDETILLPVKAWKLPVTVLSDEMQEELSEYMPIYEGDTPPNITGTYITAPVHLVHASDGYSNEFYDMRWQVEQVDELNRTIYHEWQDEASGLSVTAYLIGKGDCFTLYSIDHIINEQAGWSCELITVVSGKKITGGISDYHYAIVMRNKVDEQGQLMEPDYYRVFDDADGVASDI